MNNFHQSSINRPSAFKIWHASNHNETVISISAEFCKIVQNAILSNYCENKALVAFAKQIVPSNELRQPKKPSFKRSTPNYSRNSDLYDYPDSPPQRVHHADVDDFIEDDLE